MKNNNSELIFANTCSHEYLSGFTFHSPKIFNPTEQEVGDVVIWVRTLLVVFEIVWRGKNGESTKSFRKRIGHKRDQLQNDYSFFRSGIDIRMINKSGRKIEYLPEYFNPHDFYGVVIVDCDDPLEKLHFGTLEKVLDSEFPIAIMTKKDFNFILSEVDTPYDLKLFLHDRFQFFKEVYGLSKSTTSFFLDLNVPREKQLLAYYKSNNYSFPHDEWNPETDYWTNFQAKFSNEILARNEENENSKIIDNFINFIIESESEELPLVHAWQLAILTRRVRATLLASKISDALKNMKMGKAQRHFAIWNEITQCWLVFYFQYGGSRESMISHIEKLTNLKLMLEIATKSFRFSTIGYGFRKSELITDLDVDDIYLTVDDAKNYDAVPEESLIEASKYFKGITSVGKISEFPE